MAFRLNTLEELVGSKLVAMLFLRRGTRSTMVASCFLAKLFTMLPAAHNASLESLRTRQCPPSGHLGGISDAEVIVDLVTTLRWPTVTIVCDNCSDSSLYNDLLITLSDNSLPTKIVENNMAAWTKGDNCGVDANSGVVFLGDSLFDTAKNTFTLVCQCAKSSNKERLLFDTEWLILSPHENVDGMTDAVFKQFQNIAVITRSETSGLSLWTVLHVRDDSQLTFVSTLPPPSLPLTRHRILPNPSNGLGGRTLRVVVKESGYFVFNMTENGVQTYAGVAIDLLNELSFRLNFSYRLVPASDDSWGQELDNGQWDGPIGMLTRKEADVAVSVFAITQGRSSVADATTPFLSASSVVMYRQERSGSGRSGWTFVLQPFHPLLHAVIASCLLLLLLLLLLMDKGRRCLASRQGAPAAGTEVTLGWRIMARFEILLAGLLNRSTTFRSGSRAERALLFTWLLLSVVLTSMYSSKLTSSLTIGKTTPPFTSLAQLVRQDTYSWGVTGGTFTEAALKTSPKKDFQSFYQGVVKFAQTDPSVLSRDFKVHLEKVLKGKYAYFSGNSLRFEALAANHCDITTIPESYMIVAFGFYLQKGSPYTRHFSDKISLMVDSGLIDYWRRKWSPEKRQCEPDKGQSGRVIGLSDTQTAFYLAALGLGLATITLGLERLWQRVTAGSLQQTPV